MIIRSVQTQGDPKILWHLILWTCQRFIWSLTWLKLATVTYKLPIKIYGKNKLTTKLGFVSSCVYFSMYVENQSKTFKCTFQGRKYVLMAKQKLVSRRGWPSVVIRIQNTCIDFHCFVEWFNYFTIFFKHQCNTLVGNGFKMAAKWKK